MSHSLEIHFQEGFRGEPLTISLDQAVLAQLAPKTRFQLGLADIHRIQAAEGQVLRIELPTLNVNVEHVVRAKDAFLVVNHNGNALTIRSVPDSPGYV